MALPVVSNIPSLNAQRNLQRSTESLSKSLERLSTGLRINRAGDDAAGLAISEGLRSQIRGTQQAVRNANDGLSLIGTAESALNSYTDILQRLRELAIQSANGTNSASNRSAINQEANQLLQEMQRISTSVQFNGLNLLDGTFINKQLQVGPQPDQTISLSLGNLQTNQIGMVARKEGTAVPCTAPLSSGSLFLNGIDIGASVSDGVSLDDATHDSNSSAIAIANAINAKTSEHNVRAEALPTVYTALNPVGAVSFNGGTEQIKINGIDIVPNPGGLTVLAGDSSRALVNAINDKSNQTGVVASLDGTNRLVLTAQDGRNITITTSAGTNKADELGLVAANGDADITRGGQIRLTSPDAISVTGSNPGAAGLAVTTYPKDVNTAVNHLSLATISGANLAIDICDNALEQVNIIRAGMGAITNRLELTTQNLQAIAENLSASDSRIRDADFAAETATMTRNQILQQAGTAILAQANMTTQAALKLIQS